MLDLPLEDGPRWFVKKGEDLRRKGAGETARKQYLASPEGRCLYRTQLNDALIESCRAGLKENSIQS